MYKERDTFQPLKFVHVIEARVHSSCSDHKHMLCYKSIKQEQNYVQNSSSISWLV